MERVRTGELSARAAAEALELSRNRLYQLYHDYLAAFGPGRQEDWVPGISGGDRAPAWPPAVSALLRKRLATDPPCPCSRVFVGSKIYERELLWAYLDSLPTAFRDYGLPLEIYVDYHSFFFSSAPDALTALGQALRFYGITLRYAPTPQAKGKVEREHHFWQLRLPAYFASEPVQDLAEVNQHVTDLRVHRNQREVHRELQMTPAQAWQNSQSQGRSALRPLPRCPWWPYVWSVQKTLRTGPDGRIPIGTHPVRLEVPPGQRVTLCQHPSGHYSVLAHPPSPQASPQLLFTNRPT